MLYRAKAQVLFVLPAIGGPMLTRLRPHRDRLEARQSRKPERPVRGGPAGPPPADEDAIDRLAAALSRTKGRAPRRGMEASDPADVLLLTLGRWKRVCSWWLFTADELDRILA